MSTRGAVLAETCKGCHGVPGSHNAYPSYHVPKLGGQKADYIEIALQGYRRGTRSHATMQAQASSLSDQDIADVAAYFAARGRRARDRQIERDARSRSRRASRKSRPRACSATARPASRMRAQWPNLAGQHESYLLQASQQYKTGQRSDLLMAPIIAGARRRRRLSELAAYFSAQPHLHQTSDRRRRANTARQVPASAPRRCILRRCRASNPPRPSTEVARRLAAAGLGLPEARERCARAVPRALDALEPRLQPHGHS